MIFVDTGAWYARYILEDVDHFKAVTWFAKPPDLLLTTDYIVDELLTLLKIRGYSQIAFAVGDKLLSGNVANWNSFNRTIFSKRGQYFHSIATKTGVSPIARAEP